MIAVEEHDSKRAFQKSSDGTVGLGGYPCRCWFGIRSSADHTADDSCLAKELYKPPREAGPSPEQFEKLC